MIKYVSNNQFKTLGMIILMFSTFKVLIPIKKLEYYYLRLKRYYIGYKNNQKTYNNKLK
jgi:hypothetical protein